MVRVPVPRFWPEKATLIWALPAVATTEVGAVGGVPALGVTELEGAEVAGGATLVVTVTVQV
ncbi:MAG: hypothetical protein IPJ52_01380 [Rhodocyclaceae bacterium]|nr:hypothetical protein [Rhodocyclaceae bacterium]